MTDPRRRWTRSPLRLAALVLTLAACSGGGGDGGAPSGGDPGVGAQPGAIAVTFSPPVLTASLLHGDWPPELPVTVTLSRAPSVPVMAVVVIDAPVVDPDFPITLFGTSASTALTPLCTLVPDVYEGGITLRLCEDAGCARQVPLTGNVLPYRLTVSPGPAIRVSVDGVDATGFDTACTISFPYPEARAGQRVTFTSGIPVTWSAQVLTSAGIPSYDGVVETATTWSAVVRDDAGIGTGLLGAIEVTATPVGVTTVSGSQRSTVNVVAP